MKSIYIYLILIVLFLIDLYIFILSPIVEKKRREKNEIKRRNSIHKDNINGFYLTFEEYPRKTLIKIEGNGSLEIDTPYLRIEEKTILENVQFRNLKKIYEWNIVANSVEFVDSKYSARDGAIYDYLDQLNYFYQEKTQKQLIDLAKKESISKKALKFFTNATYAQFYAGEAEIRISKPYTSAQDEAYLICPSKLGKYKITKVSINYGLLNLIYIPENVETIILEKEVQYENIINDSVYLKIRNNCIVSKKDNMYISYGKKVFRHISTENPDNLQYTNKYTYKKILGTINFTNIDKKILK